MQFLRQNLFLVVTIVAVVVIGAVLMWPRMSMSDSIESKMKERADLSAKIEKLAHGPQVDANVVDAERIRVQSIQSAVLEVAARSDQWNKQILHVPVLPCIDAEGKTVKTVAAFPVDSAEGLADYRAYGLEFRFTEKYISDLGDLRMKLKPARPPTEAEVTDYVNTAEKKRLATMGPHVTTAPPTTEPGMAPAQDNAAITAQAQIDGRAAAMVDKAKAGGVYVEPNSFDVIFSSGRSRVSEEQLWEAWLNMQVQQVIVDSIADTNAQVWQEEKVSAGQQNVLSAAVKRLVKVDVDEKYFFLAGAEAGAPGHAPVEHGPAEHAPGANVAAAGGGDLTQRETCKQYETIHYNFIVVMPSRHLPRLERNLSMRCYNTTLAVSCSNLGPAEASANYYYGTEPVMKVTLYMEMLTLADCTRGQWNAKENKWSTEYPPLMPKKVLETLGQALRDEDRKRLEQK